MSRKNKNSYLKSKEFKVHQFKMLKYEIVQKKLDSIAFQAEDAKNKNKISLFCQSQKYTFNIFQFKTRPAKKE